MGAGRAGRAARRRARPQPGLREGRVGALHAQQLGQLRRGARRLPAACPGRRLHRPLRLLPAFGHCRRGRARVCRPLPRRRHRVLGQQRRRELPAAGPAARPARRRTAAGPRQHRLDPLHLRRGGGGERSPAEGLREGIGAEQVAEGARSRQVGPAAARGQGLAAPTPQEGLRGPAQASLPAASL